MKEYPISNTQRAAAACFAVGKVQFIPAIALAMMQHPAAIWAVGLYASLIFASVVLVLWDRTRRNNYTESSIVIIDGVKYRKV